MRLYTQDQLREVAARAWELQREHLGVPHPPPGAPPDSAMAVPTAPTAPTGGQPLSDGSILIDDDDAWGGWSSEGQEHPEGPEKPQGPPAATLMPQPKWPGPPRPQGHAEPKRMPIASGTLAIADQVRVTVEVPRGHGGSLQGSPCQSPRSRSGHGGEGWLHGGAQSQYEERLRQDDRADPAWRDWNLNRRVRQGPEAPRDPPVPAYDRYWGADRLAHLYNVPEPPRPYRVGADGIQADLVEFQWQLMSYVLQNRKVPQERQQYLEDLTDMYKVPEKYLTLITSRDLSEWHLLMREDPDLQDLSEDPGALNYWRRVSTHPGAGMFEANRILYHLLKDSWSDRRQMEPVKWLVGACKEALHALQSPDEWSAQAQRRKGLMFLQNGTSQSGQPLYAWMPEEPRRPWSASDDRHRREWREPRARGYGWSDRDHHHYG